MLYKCCLSAQMFSIGSTQQAKQLRGYSQFMMAVRQANGSTFETGCIIEPELRRRLEANQTVTYVESGKRSRLILKVHWPR